MKKFLLASAAIVAFSAGAQAADLGVRRAPIEAVIAVPAFNWTGFYAGAHVGYGWGRTGGTFYTVGGGFQSNEPASPNGVFGGLQAGYNWQFNSIVLGLETDISLAALSDSRLYNVNPAFTHHTRIGWMGSTRVRAGFAVDKALFYATGGVAYGGVNIGTTPPPIGIASSRTRVGFALGAGLEYAVAPNWTVKAEYMYYNFGTANLVQSTAAEYMRVNTQVHTVKLGVNYLFSTGPGAVVARY